MKIENLYQGTVIDNDDPDKEGRVKIRCEEIMSGWQDSHLPWARPFSGSGGSSESGQSNIPEEGDLLWCFPEKSHSMKNWYYISGSQLSDVNPHSLFEDNVKSSVGSQASYPDVKFWHFKNKVCLAVSSSITTPEIMVYHPSGTFVFIDSDGKITIETPDDIEMKAGTVKIDADLEVTGEIKGDKEITWNNATVPTKASTHTHTSAVAGNQSSSPTPGS